MCKIRKHIDIIIDKYTYIAVVYICIKKIIKLTTYFV